MTEELFKTTKEEISKLPKEKQEAINSCDWLDISKKIGLKYFLDEEETNKLQAEILIILTEADYLSNLDINLETSLLINKKESQKIINEIVEKIINPIRKKLDERLRDGVRIKEATWQQTINFIVSGGDYSVFLE